MGLLNWTRDGTIVGPTRNEIDIRCDAQGENWITVKGPNAEDIASQVLSNRYASKQRDELREALVPVLVQGASQVEPEHDDSSPVEITITASQFRRLNLANLNKTDGE